MKNKFQLAGQMQRFDDDTVFNRSYMAEGTLTNSNNAYTVGWLTDAGPEAGVHTGLNETVNATGLDPVGAIAVMNLGSFRSNSEKSPAGMPATAPSLTTERELAGSRSIMLTSWKESVN